MESRFLEAGIIINSHGVRGEVKIRPWADSPGFFAGLERIFINGAPIKIMSARAHKDFVIAALEGVSDIDGAIRLKNKIVSIDRGDVHLDDGQFFIADLIGLRAVDCGTGAELGIVVDIMPLPANDVYVIKGTREILVPAVPDFIIETDIAGGFVKIRLIEGM